MLVHIDHQRYLTVFPGRLSCTHGSTVLPLNLTMGQQIDLHPEDNCVNEAVHIGRQMLRLQDFEIDTTGDKAVDTLLTAKVGQKDAQVETMVAMKDAHRLLNMKLRQDITMAQEDISTFVEDTLLALDSVTLSTSFSLGGVQRLAACGPRLCPCAGPQLWQWLHGQRPLRQLSVQLALRQLLFLLSRALAKVSQLEVRQPTFAVQEFL